MPNNRTDEAIALAIVECTTKKQAAEQLQMKPRALYDRLQRPKVRALIASLRADQTRSRLAAIEDAQQKAVSVLMGVLDDDAAPTEYKIRAAKIILDAGRAARQEITAADQAADLTADQAGTILI